MTLLSAIDNEIYFNKKMPEVIRNSSFVAIKGKHKCRIMEHKFISKNKNKNLEFQSFGPSENKNTHSTMHIPNHLALLNQMIISMNIEYHMINIKTRNFFSFFLFFVAVYLLLLVIKQLKCLTTRNLHSPTRNHLLSQVHTFNFQQLGAETPNRAIMQDHTAR